MAKDLKNNQDENLDKLLSYTLEHLGEKDKEALEKDLISDVALNQALIDVQMVVEAVALADQPIEPSTSLKQTLFDSLGERTPFAGYVERFMRLFDLGRDSVESILDKITAAPETTFESCGIPKTVLFYFDGGEKIKDHTCGILKIRAGGIFPAHQHRGKEWVLVLQGSAFDQSGLEYLPGDVIYSDDSVSHALKIGKQEDLIFAVALEKPNKWLVGEIIKDYLLPNRRFK